MSVAIVVVLVILWLSFMGAFIGVFVKYEQLLSSTPPAPNDQTSSDLPYTYCQSRPECIQSPQEYAQIFSSNRSDGFFGPACLSYNMLGRVIALSGNSDPNWMPTTLGRVGTGSRIAFAISTNTLERMLPMGNQQANLIVQTLGFGTGFTCGTPSKNYTDCQYRLVLWTAPCIEGRPPVTQGYWQNLAWFLQTYVYGLITPSLSEAIAEINSAGGQLDAITGCNGTLTPNNYWNPAAQTAAGCSADFITQMAYFSRGSCTGNTSSVPQYSPTAGCLAENRFLSLESPTAVQLRAYLMQNEAFNPYYTGYGYTAGSDYYIAEQEEFWYPNNFISDLAEHVIVTFYNGTNGYPS